MGADLGRSDAVFFFPPAALVTEALREASTHRGHLVGDEVALLRQHVGHHERGQLRVRVRVDEPVVWQRVAEVARGIVLHQVKRRGLGVVGRGDGGDLVVLVPGSAPTCRAAAPSPAASGLACVALGRVGGGGGGRRGEKRWDWPPATPALPIPETWQEHSHGDRKWLPSKQRSHLDTKAEDEANLKTLTKGNVTSLEVDGWSYERRQWLKATSFMRPDTKVQRSVMGIKPESWERERSPPQSDSAYTSYPCICLII